MRVITLLSIVMVMKIIKFLLIFCHFEEPLLSLAFSFLVTKIYIRFGHKRHWKCIEVAKYITGKQSLNMWHLKYYLAYNDANRKPCNQWMFAVVPTQMWLHYALIMLFSYNKIFLWLGATLMGYINV